MTLRLVDESVQVQVRLDAQRFQQVMANLLSNAAKFSPSGDEVLVGVHLLGEHVRIEVTDHGPGISAAFRERIFQKFSQADASDALHQQGSGLGLAITRELVQHLGGRIGFESCPGLTCFYLEFPVIRNEVVGD